jgi:hypothetical protein
MAAVSSNQLTSGFTLNHRMLYPVLVYISYTDANIDVNIQKLIYDIVSDDVVYDES